MRRPHVAAATLSLALWVVAGSLFLGEAAPVSAQDGEERQRLPSAVGFLSHVVSDHRIL